jgi:hypothetical protein
MFCILIVPVTPQNERKKGLNNTVILSETSGESPSADSGAKPNVQYSGLDCAFLGMKNDSAQR